MNAVSAVESFLAGSENLRTAVAGMSPEQAVARPIPGRWSVLEVVCHLVDTDANIAHRLKRILSEDRPTFDRVQPDPVAARNRIMTATSRKNWRSSSSVVGRSPAS